jgi:histidinol-phosphate/aromatic aminotransferase/cobyric acid decarboxylase-like protein
MQPLSDHCHKALLSVGGATILGRIMDSLEHVGINRVTVVTGYRADDIEDFLRTGYPDIDLRLVHNSRFRETNNIVSLSMAFDAMDFDADVVLVECDLLFDPTLMTRLVDHPGLNVALVDRYRTGMDGTVVELSDGFVTDVYPNDVQDANFSYVNKFKTLNIYRFDQNFCRNAFAPLLHTYANNIDSSCYYEIVLGMLTNIRAHRVSAEVVASERWAEVDDPNDLAVASFKFEPSRRSAILDRSFGGHWNFDLMDFSFMRNAHFPTGAMLASMHHAFPELIASYGSAQPILNEKLGYFLRSDPGCLVVLHGASQIFPILASKFSSRSITIPTATFGEYSRLFVNAVTYPDSPGVDWSELERNAANFEIVVVVNPNTSTGTTLESRAIHALAKRTPDTLFWVDESFLAFSDQPSLVTLLNEDPLSNVLVLVSLSKSLGVPGLRLGYAFSCDRSLIAGINEELPVWNLSAPSEFLLELLLKFGPAYETSLERTVSDREAFRTLLESLPFVVSVPTSGGNFLLVELKGTDPTFSAQIRNWLLVNHNIEIKDVSSKFSDRRARLRVAVRSSDDNELLVETLKGLPEDLYPFAD